MGGGTYASGNSGNGGYGGNITTTLSVVPTTAFYIYVGNNGGFGDTNINGLGGKSADSAINTTYGICSGGTGSTFAGGGGAASYVAFSQVQGQTPIPVLIAGGGGGAGYYTNGGSGCVISSGSTDSDGTGGNGNDYNTFNYKGGIGGSISSTLCGNLVGLNSPDVNSGKPPSMTKFVGGGGGGCNPGGISNGSYCGGGAGGSYIDSTIIITRNTSFVTDTTGLPSITINWYPPPTTTKYIPTTTTKSIPTTTTKSIPTTTKSIPTTTLQSVTTTSQSVTTTTSQSSPTTTNPYVSIPSTTNNAITHIPIITYGYKISESPETDIYQNKFDGTSNVYAPVVYRNLDTFAPINSYDDKYAKY
jgi:hypothetical protein